MLAGVCLLAVYVRIGTVLGFQAAYGPVLERDALGSDGPSPFVPVVDSEHRFWLAHLVLAIPGALLIAWGLTPRLGPALRRLVARIDTASPRAWRWAGVALFVTLCLWSMIGRHIVMLDRPLTDDENAVTFGARMIAKGHIGVPLLHPAGVFTDLFTYQHDGLVSSMDFPGVLGFAALAILTGLGGMLYALASAVSGVAVAYAAGRWFGPRARVLAAITWIVSPMVSSLSLTGHAHVASRMFVALALALAARLDTGAGWPRRDAVLFGACAGAGLLCRPLEVAALLAPVAGWLTWRALRGRGEPRLPRSTLLWMLAGIAPAVVTQIWYDLQMTGLWYLQPRFAPGIVGASKGAFGSHNAWDRLGFNLGSNALVFAVFFLGIPMIAAVIGGIDRRRPILIVLATGALLALLVCLAHDNTGIHSVGPIHLSEMTVPLVLLVSAGLVRGFAWLASRGLPSTLPAMLLAGYLVIGCGLFGISNLASLRRQATTQAFPEQVLDSLDVHHAIVIADPYFALVQVNRTFAPWGSWVIQYPHPDPFFRDDVIFAHDTGKADEVDQLHATFPDRAIYQMTYASGRSPIHVSLLRQAGP